MDAAQMVDAWACKHSLGFHLCKCKDVCVCVCVTGFLSS